ncbi:hypothetical protein BJF93_17075 [Xaviernesmea oryzae]|uniref:LysM domain-containing protein n=1 Tax=Xaviernesmea oryzae TaxID=464029 RepID=A0A1Q9AT62_9HYPH|nr:LysM peptidoglycan-binding domain-containing protein [Xaviernesmea oryzae]OLP58569.1 hypothetical protein BJF93_17075 [Xaviernesmea oryzae]SEK62346.1 LysM domain-containing protein [Xaviernesmea oryzae]
MKNKAGLVALIVLAAATLLMVFLVLPNIGNKAVETAATAPGKGVEATPAPLSTPSSPLPQPNDQPTDAKAPSTGAAAPAPQPSPQAAAPVTQDAPAASAQAGTAGNSAAPESQPAPDTGAPSFDVLRVERDGSTVIAGRAAPDSNLSIVSGDTVISTTKVSPGGEFAAVLDQPLPPGDYQLTLRATGKDGTDKRSDEVATVSVPKSADGELLAMVSKPGEASRIITAPGQGDDSAPAPAVSAPPANSADGKPADATAAASTAQPPATPSPTAPSTALPAVRIAVTAVEIEGRRLFVAGTAPAAALVRVYADSNFVGEAKAGSNAHFVVDGQIDLSVGSHIIRADLIGPDGVKVVMRASVPFERPAGAQVAAVAQAPTDGVAGDADSQALDMARGQVRKAFTLLKGLFAGDQVPQADALAAARSATEISLGTLSGLRPEPAASQDTRARIQQSASAAAQGLAILKPAPRDTAGVKAVLGKLEEALGPVLRDGAAPALAQAPETPAAQTPAPQSAASQGPAASPQTQASAEQPAAQPAPSEQAAAAPQAAPDATEPPTVEQAPLQQSRNSVIIRRGDTLWQISRRVYGAGVRYTTIYVANEDQINDPDRILPGQIFGVPDSAMPDAQSQEIHRRHMKQLRDR